PEQSPISPGACQDECASMFGAAAETLNERWEKQDSAMLDMWRPAYSMTPLAARSPSPSLRVKRMREIPRPRPLLGRRTDVSSVVIARIRPLVAASSIALR